MITTIGRAAVEPGTVIVHGSAAGFAQEIAAGRHPLTADEPISVGGTDSRPTPYDLEDVVPPHQLIAPIEGNLVIEGLASENPARLVRAARDAEVVVA